MPIQILPEEVVAQIAAGEVVERPASVVKELLENALDAGADHIRVEVTGGGRQRIRISDNGCGIAPDEAPLAFYRHATSKLRTADDLTRITTLGFRGEALASIASVSHLTMVTRHESAPGGLLLRLAGGQMVEQKPVGAPLGTVITVENLFYNTPARLKFMKKDGTEKRHVALIVSRYAMAYPQVRFVLEQDGREVFRSSGSGYLGDVLVAALGLDTFRDMVELRADSSAGPIQVYGYTSVPSLHRADRTHITLFINGRWIQDTRLAYAVTQAYHTFLMTGRYPVSVLMLNLPPEDVDVNVHPTKAEVRFRDSDGVFTAVQRAVRRAIIDLAQTPAMRGGYYTEHGKLGDWHAGDVASQMDLNLELDSAGQYARQRSGLSRDEAVDPTAIPAGPGAPARPRTLPILRVVGQIGATYIIAEGPAGMYLIDQHAAHERILYEQFMEEHARQGTPTQYALAAQTLYLPPAEAHLIEAHLDVLRHVGFDLEPFGPNTFVVRAVPAMLASEAPADVLVGILEDLELGETPGQASIEDKIITRVCKQAAVKAGQILSVDEMQGLIRQLERCQTPLTCPHGRPTMIHMTTDQLARQFGRMG
ncbi:MAG: DNA mismatch repair endonuclease MutL [Chloroflexi bacterium]|nr:DNA mismatch repair endonuclease MutL [Chloroflexota bacterium]